MNQSTFRGDKAFLSNFYESNFVVNNKIYASVEHFFQASKSNNDIDHEQIRLCNNPSMAKRIGRRIQIRPDWEEQKVNIMYQGVYAKFYQNFDLSIKLIKTYPDILEEVNDWNDRFWGIDIKTNKGQNMLGKILMRVRDELQETLIIGGWIRK